MAVTSEQPVSVGNLAAMVESGAVGGGVTLYEGSGTSSSITLSQSAAGFHRLGICVRNNTQYNVAEVYTEAVNPNGRTVGMAVGGNQWSSPGIANVSINGTSMTVSGKGVQCGFMFVIGYK